MITTFIVSFLFQVRLLTRHLASQLLWRNWVGRFRTRLMRNGLTESWFCWSVLITRTYVHFVFLPRLTLQLLFYVFSFLVNESRLSLSDYPFAERLHTSEVTGRVPGFVRFERFCIFAYLVIETEILWPRAVLVHWSSVWLLTFIVLLMLRPQYCPNAACDNYSFRIEMMLLNHN